MVPVLSSAVISEDGLYRYSLTRYWDDVADGQWLVIIGLNPSTADAVVNDRTINREIDFAKRWGYGGFIKLNLFAWRTKSPKVMTAMGDLGIDIVGPANNAMILQTAARAKTVLAAWGQSLHGDPLFNNQVARVRQWISRLHHLGLTTKGHPWHPLYLPATTVMEKWQ